MTKYFWENREQASERLMGSFIMYGDEPAMVELVDQRADHSLRAHLRLFPGARRATADLDDPKFFRFRKLPPTGWFNSVEAGAAMHLERRPVRNRRLHGFDDGCIGVGFPSRGDFSEREYRWTDVVNDEGYNDLCKDDFPPLDQIIAVIQPSTCIAFTPMYAVMRDKVGIRWMYRERKRVGLFPDASTLLLVGSSGFLREELSEDRRVNVRTIQEF